MIYWKIRLLATGMATAIALLLLVGVEALFWLAEPVDPGFAAVRDAEAAGNPFDLRSRGVVVEDLRKDGIDAFPRLVPAAILEAGEDGRLRSRMQDPVGRELLPLAGISGVTTVLCNETGRYAIYESDEHGFRNPTRRWPEPPIDLALIGDSFTIGECVGPGETIADGLRSEGTSVVNLGYSGHSPLLELATLSEYGPALEPRITLWLHYENDLSFFDLERSARSPLLMRYLDADFSQSLLERQPEIDRKLRELVARGEAGPDDASRFTPKDPSDSPAVLDLRTTLRAFLTLKRTRRGLARIRRDLTRGEQDLEDPLYASILRAARDRVAGWQGELVVVYLPGVWRFDGTSEAPRWSHPDANRFVGATARSLGLRFIDLTEILSRHPDAPSLYSYRGESRLGSPHMNAEGYAVTAGVLRARLRH